MKKSLKKKSKDNILSKICTGCRVDKRLEDFCKDASSPHGRAYACRKCRSERSKKYYLENSDKVKHNAMEYHRKNYKKFSKKKKAYAKKRLERLKLFIYNFYGGALCSCCGEKRIQFLTIDHINRDGKKHHINGKIPTGSIYSWIIKNNFPGDIRVLCFNCNCGRERNGGVCPHEEENEPKEAQQTTCLESF